ncbi:BirA family transcriptional regulator, biotin operon repressor / biotin-[acetyl-CoA-carboxylase] ligase [Caloranaerobacter azorensis DSM 13643]|uniref:Bifunctional ligase/repressor BirA n=1 Tax=Caloranaerobacter azorensis DSM 13643 TaxID=1121264 RepID=A0A1M5SUT7_9FIRM|nr:biotin--[acetyl-CoA-carboxylase] ligase [Caloranaerobacter azorensis]SHH42321.1 BirA family transcriptional regulator, biotin operon repressor / biotin-[acetyl-CoA-carboxylase] ligase [Caloranaerobacter azorensis DSM 13643]
MKDEILKLLKENNEFVSGQDISDSLNVSRTAIWKYINQLREEGYLIDSVTRKGYKLIYTPDILTYGEIAEYLETDYIGRKIIHFDSIDSTNIKAKQLAAEGAKEGTVVIAEEQTMGRGRLGRGWVSPKGKGIWMSIILRPNIDPIDASKVTQIGAAAVWSALSKVGVDAYIKWPNDIVLNGKKVCGILTEMSAELNRINYLVIGIGVNVNINSQEIPKEINNIATSIKAEVGHDVDRKFITAEILNNFERFYNELIKYGSIKTSIEICRKASILLGREIKIITNKGERRAKAIDITEQGELLIEENGKIEKLISGEISVRGIYGYV